MWKGPGPYPKGASGDFVIDVEREAERQRAIAESDWCTYHTGHGVCGEPEAWAGHGVRQPLDFGGPHRFRNDPSGEDQMP